MNTSRSKKSFNYTRLLLMFLAVNMLALDYVVISKILHNSTVLGTATVEETCPIACVDRINQAIGKTTTNSAKEYYIPLGSGTNATDDWSDVAGASAYVDTTSYSNIKDVRFEATVTIPFGSQRIWVRLFNATDKHPVWYSDITTDSSGPLLLSSPSINLDKGNKRYQVQMKSQLKGLTNLTQSRIHITTR